MILVTVGTQLPFDRLIEAVDQWAAYSNEKVFAQIGQGKYIPRNMEYKRFLNSEEMNDFYDSSELILSHAGMGTIINALQRKKRILVLPRLAKYSEHRNDHQLATAESFTKKGYIQAAFTENELVKLLDSSVSVYDGNIGQYASDDLINYLKKYIQES